MPKADRILTCVCCGEQLETVFNGFQPVDGLAFSTQGHYGSGYFDPMDGSYLEVALCDPCVKRSEENGFVNRVERPK